MLSRAKVKQPYADLVLDTREGLGVPDLRSDLRTLA